MRLAEALILRADYQKRIEQLKQRLLNNAKVQEGEAPAEDPQVLLDEVARVTADLVLMIQRINKTNTLTSFDTGGTLSDALATRDVLKLRLAIYRDLAQAAAVKQDRYSRSEVKFRSSVNVAELQKQADLLAREYRELDAKIQEMNWRTDLME